MLSGMTMRQKYAFLRFAEENVQTLLLKNNDHALDQAIEYILDEIKGIKKDIRKEHKRHDADTGRVIKSDWDSYITLEELKIPADYTYDDAVEYFEEYEVIHMVPSQYDCTGQLFTSWYKIFKRNGKWMAYHAVNADV